MSTDDGLVHISYNGEVYNFRELRAELEAVGHDFHTTCDTEVVLHAYAEWGTDCFARFNGMWGVAFLDLRGEHAAGRARPRPLRHQADVLRAVRRPRALRVGDQGDPPRPHVRAARRRPADVRVPRVRPLRPHRGHVLRGRARGSGGRVRDRRRQRCARRALLGAGAVGDRLARSGRLPCRVRPRGGAPARRRRSRRHLPERRARLVVDLHRDGTASSKPTCPTRCRWATGSRRSPRCSPATPSTRPATSTACSTSPARPRAVASPPPKTSSARWSRGSGTSRSRWCRARRSPCGW